MAKWNEGGKHKRPFKTKSKIAGAKFKKPAGGEHSSSAIKSLRAVLSVPTKVLAKKFCLSVELERN
jgi:hypothetical protein